VIHENYQKTVELLSKTLHHEKDIFKRGKNLSWLAIGVNKMTFNVDMRKMAILLEFLPFVYVLV